MLRDPLTLDALTSQELSDSVRSNPVVKFLQTRIGLEPESLGARVISDCLSDLAREFPGRSFTAIALSAQQDREMFDRVVGHFSVNESWLFRNPEQFAELRVFVQARAWCSDRPLKVLSLPCACGEEPASIAITLQEAGLLPGAFSIIAGDLDSNALSKARKGTFGLSAFRGAFPDPRWFELRDQQYILSPSLLARIEYRQINVLDTNLFQGKQFDVIFCRNLLIYLHGDARAHVVQLLRRVAAPGAVVFTGTAEPSLSFDEPLKGVSHIISSSTSSLRGAKQRGNPFSMPTKQGGLLRSTRNDEAEHAAKAALKPVPEPEPDPDIASGWRNCLARAEQHANDGDLPGACLTLDQLLDEAPTYAEAWYLRGVLASAQNDLSRAEIALDRAAYLDPSHAPTLRLRAELARRGGDTAHADRIRARLKRREGVQ